MNVDASASQGVGMVDCLIAENDLSASEDADLGLRRGIDAGIMLFCLTTGMVPISATASGELLDRFESDEATSSAFRFLLLRFLCMLLRRSARSMSELLRDSRKEIVSSPTACKDPLSATKSFGISANPIRVSLSVDVPLDALLLDMTIPLLKSGDFGLVVESRGTKEGDPRVDRGVFSQVAFRGLVVSNTVLSSRAVLVGDLFRIGGELLRLFEMPLGFDGFCDGFRDRNTR